MKQVHFNKHVSINLLVKEQKFTRGTISKFKYYIGTNQKLCFHRQKKPSMEIMIGYTKQMSTSSEGVGSAKPFFRKGDNFH